MLEPAAVDLPGMAWNAPPVRAVRKHPLTRFAVRRFGPGLAAAAVGDPRRVLAGTDCGFDTAAGLGEVAFEVVWRKLAELADGARLASARLFG